MKTRIFAAVLLLAAAAQARAGKPGATRKLMSATGFEFEAPSGWSRKPGGEGVVLLGPADADDVSCVLRVRRYADGGKEYPDLEAFVARRAAPPLFEGSPRAEILPAVEVAGRKARRFARDGTEFVPPSARNTKGVPTREETVAVPGQGFFYEISYSAPKSLFAKNRSALERALKTFKPK